MSLNLQEELPEVWLEAPPIFSSAGYILPLGSMSAAGGGRGTWYWKGGRRGIGHPGSGSQVCSRMGIKGSGASGVGSELVSWA